MTIKKTQEQIGVEAFKAMIKRMISDAETRVERHARERILKNIRPLYLMNSIENYSPLGTGVLVRVDERFYLCSAAHVFDDFDSAASNSPCELVTFGQTKTVILSEKVIRTAKAPDDPEREKDLVDIGFMELRVANIKQIGRDRFLSLEDMDFEDGGSYTSLYSALGYPATRNKVEWKAVHSGQTITPSPIVYSCQNSPPEHFAKYRLSKDQNLMVRFQKKKSTTSEGRRIHAPDAHAMSGGGLWRYRKYSLLHPLNDGPVDLKLVGIIIEWRKNPEGFIVTCASYLRDLLMGESSQSS
jgi:hypothetical protein